MNHWNELLKMADKLVNLEPDPLGDFEKSIQVLRYQQEDEIKNPKDDWDFVKNSEMRALSWLALKINCPIRTLMTVLGKIRSGRLSYHRHLRNKSDGGIRIIDEPPGDLKEIQKKIKDMMLSEIFFREDVYGFSGGSVVGALEKHLKSKYFFMLDIRNAFPSINSRIVLKILRNKDLILPEELQNPADKHEGFFSKRISRILVDFCMFRGYLPQGSPASPRLFDIVFYKADRRLVGMAQENSIIYTRYADNLFFSSQKNTFGKWFRDLTDLIIFTTFLDSEMSVRSHKKRKYTSAKKAIRSLGLNIIDEKLHNTRQFKRRLRLHLHHLAWLKKNGQDYEHEYSKLTGMMGWAIPKTLPNGLWEKTLQAKKAFYPKE